MVFTVTYRAKDGALREERVDAANRAECVAECRKRGISPTKIVEGGKSKGRDGARSSHVARPPVGYDHRACRITGKAAILAAEVPKFFFPCSMNLSIPVSIASIAILSPS